MTDTEATAAATDAPRKELTAEQEVNRVLYRAVARALARMETGEGDFKTQWNEGRTKYVNDARKLAKALRKERVTLTVEPKPAGEAPDPED